MRMRAWKFRLYPSEQQENLLDSHLEKCKNLWNSLLEQSKRHYQEKGKFPTRNQLNAFTRGTPLFSQVAQNVADRLAKSMLGVVVRKRAGMKVGFPRFKALERMKSFTYPQFGFKLDKHLILSGIGKIQIRKHRKIQGFIKTLTIKKFSSGKWFAIFTSVAEEDHVPKNRGVPVGIDLGIEHFAYLSNGAVIENPGYLKSAERMLREKQRRLFGKKMGSQNRRKARAKVAVSYEKLTNKRRDFLHKTSRKLVEKYSFIAMERLNVAGMARGFLAKSVLDCGWAEFSGMLRYKAEEAGCEVVLVNPANTTSECSSCGLVQRKSLAERWHNCACGASMHRDLNAAINILNRATLGHRGSNACGEETSTSYKHNGASIFCEAGSPALYGGEGHKRFCG